jgi:hypothetical protein
MQNMLQKSDLPYIAKAVAPLAFSLVEGRVIVEVPEGLAQDVLDEATGIVRRVPYVFDMSQEDIENRVAAYRLGEHRNKIAVAFTDHLLVKSSVTTQLMHRTGIDPSQYPNTDPEVEPWLDWTKKLVAQIDQAKTPDDVKVPEFPPFPSWHRQSPALYEAAKRLGHPGPFQVDHPIDPRGG